MIGRIYAIDNVKTAKPVYVGFTQKTVDERLKKHFQMALTTPNKNNQTVLCQAIREDGKDNFKIRELYASKDIDHCFKEMEKHFIAEYSTMQPLGYNGHPGGGHKLKPLKKKNNT